jgi:hypothetical protein
MWLRFDKNGGGDEALNVEEQSGNLVNNLDAETSLALVQQC